MINGYENLYGVNGGNAKYDRDYEAHDSHIVGSNFSFANMVGSGVTSRPVVGTMLNLAEQNLGAQSYKNVLDTCRAYDALQIQRAQIGKTMSEITNTTAELDTAQKQLQKIQNEFSAAKADLAKIDPDDYASLAKAYQKLAELQKALNSATQQVKQLENKLNNLNTRLNAEQTEAQNLFANMKNAINQVEPSDFAKLDKVFEDNKREELSQDLVDSVLLPGNTAKEENKIREIGNTVLDAMGVELVNAKLKVMNAEKMDEKSATVPLDKQEQAYNDMIGDLDRLSNFDCVIDDAKFVGDSNFGKLYSTATKPVLHGNEEALSSNELYYYATHDCRFSAYRAEKNKQSISDNAISGYIIEPSARLGQLVNEGKVTFTKLANAKARSTGMNFA